MLAVEEVPIGDATKASRKKQTLKRAEKDESGREEPKNVSIPTNVEV